MEETESLDTGPDALPFGLDHTSTPAENAQHAEDLPPSQRGIRRRELLPAWAVIVAASLLVLLLGAAVAVPAILSAQRVTVPDVAGLSYDSAVRRLEEAGLEARRGDERFSPDVPKGSVIDQTPQAGQRIARGTVVVLAVSAGTESFAMPDVVGKPLEQARSELAERGLSVRVDVVPSENASGTVISTLPAPGAEVTTSDIVRVTVAGPGEASSALLPYNLQGLSIAIDPSPVATGTADVPMEVTRRLRALLEASGATVTVTRDATNRDPSAKARANSAREATAVVVVGLTVATRGAGGLAVLTSPPSATQAPFQARQTDLANRMASQLRDSDRVVRVGTEKDAVFSRLDVPAARLRLGSLSDRQDELAFRDPRWSDEIARAVYRAVGEVFGRK